MWNFHLNLTQDIGHGVTIIFMSCVLIIVACFIDLWTGIDAAKKNKEKIRSKALRRRNAILEAVMDADRVLNKTTSRKYIGIRKRRSRGMQLHSTILQSLTGTVQA